VERAKGEARGTLKERTRTDEWTNSIVPGLCPRLELQTAEGNTLANKKTVKTNRIRTLDSANSYDRGRSKKGSYSISEEKTKGGGTDFEGIASEG